MSIAQRLVNLSDGLSAEGILSAAKGGTGTTTGAGSSTPTISSINYGGDDTATNPAGGQTITLTGTNFASGAKVLINTTAVGVVTVVSSTQITFTAPALSAGSYILYVVNLDGSTAIAVPGIQYSGTPAWTTAAGSLGTNYETGAVSTTVSATSDSTVTYSVVSGTLPSGVTINSSGTISGTSPAVGGSTTYTFTVRATDLELQDTDRQFSLTINPDVVTWSSANAFAIQQDAASTTTLSATSAAGQTVSYSVDTLPAGLTLSGATVSGTATTAGTTSTIATATAAVTGKTAQQTITWTVSIAADAYWKYTTLLLNGESATTSFLSDASTNNFQLSASGDARPSNFGPYTTGYYSVALDSQRHLSTPANTAFDFGSGDFTVEAWVYFKTYNSMQYSGHTIATTYENNNGWNFGFNGQNGIDGLAINTYSGNNLATSVSATGVNSSVVPLNKWHHVAVTKSGSTVRIFVNGVGYTTSGTYTAVGAGGRFAIGVYQQNMTYSGNPNWNISNLRVVKGTAVYTTDFTPPITPLTAITGTSLLACQGNRFVDASANAFVLTASSTSNISVSSFVPFQPNSSYSTYGSTYFDGNGDYVTYTGGSTTTLSADFTFECWVYLNNLSANQPIICIGDGYNLGALFFIDTAGKLRLYANNVQILTGTGTAVANTWNHVAFVRSGTTVTAYLNGVAGGTATSSSQWSGTTTYIGREIYNTGTGIQLAGYLSDLRLVKGTALYTANFTVPTQPLTAVSGTSLLTCQTNQPHTNSQFLDNSTSALTITRTGNATQGSFSPYGASWSNYFDGSGDYVTAPAGTGAMGTGDFTIELWAYHTTSDAWAGYYYQGEGGSGGGINFRKNNANKLSLSHDGVVDVFTTTASVPINQWTHLAVTRSSGTVRAFIDGVLAATTTYTGNFTGTSGQQTIGSITSGLYFMAGYISNFRVVKGTALYTSAFTPATQPLTAVAGTELLTCQSPNFVDNSLKVNAIGKGGDTRVERFSPFSLVTQTPVSHSVYFDGSGDYLTLPSSSAFSMGTGDFTIEAWVYTTTSNTQRVISSTGNNFELLLINTGSNVYLNWYDGVGDTTSGTNYVPQNSWAHVAVSRSGNSLKLFINGTVSGASTNSVSLPASPTLYIGRYGGGDLNAFTGCISNLRVIKSTAVYTANFTPATQPLTAVAGTSLLTCQDATIRDNSANNFTLTAVGNAAPRRQNPFGYTTSSAQDYAPAVFGSSAYFDGSDYLEFPLTNNTFKFGTGEFTIEFWVYPTSAPNNNWSPFFTIGGSGGGQEIRISQNQLGGGYGYLVPNNALNADIYPYFGNFNIFEWHHLALVRSGTTVSFYRNGVLVGTTTSATFNFTNTSVGRIAHPQPAYADGSYIGYMSDVRIANKALYTANFVPPNAPLQAVSGTVLLLNMDKSAVQDKSGKVVLETVGDVKVSTSVKKYGSSSMYFDGNGDYMLIAGSQSTEFGGGDFTIEMWWYPTSTSRQPLYHGSFGTDWGIGIDYSSVSTNQKIGIWASSNGSSWNLLNADSGGNGIGTTTLVQNTWNHIAFVRSGTSWMLFVNGNRDVNVTGLSGTIVSRPTAQRAIGSWFNTSAIGLINGYIDDLRITKGYARYTANFTPPQQALLTK